MIDAIADAASRSSGLLLYVAWILLVVFLLIALACVGALLLLRARRRLVARRRDRETADLRADLVAVVVGEEPDAGDATRRLIALRGRHRDRADELLAAMLPKVRGDAKVRVLDVLKARGAEARALMQLRSRRSIARCRGAFALGAMGANDVTDHIVPLLADRSPEVQRVAVRALGLIGDPAATRPLLKAANRTVEIQRDIIQALVQLGPTASPVMRERLAYQTARPDPDDRSGPVAATALGLRGDVDSARALAAAVERGAPPLRLAAALALGNLDSPAGVPALQGALSAPSEQLQLAAATSLGRLGAESAISSLLAAVERDDPTVSRSAAAALLDLGPGGRRALAASTARYAVETLAVDSMRRPHDQ